MKNVNVAIISTIGAGGATQATEAVVWAGATQTLLMVSFYVELLIPPVLAVVGIMSITFKVHDWWNKRK